MNPYIIEKIGSYSDIYIQMNMKLMNKYLYQTINLGPIQKIIKRDAHKFYDLLKKLGFEIEYARLNTSHAIYPSDTFFVYIVENKIIGIINILWSEDWDFGYRSYESRHFQKKEKGCCLMQYMEIHQNYRKKGSGKKMIEYIKKYYENIPIFFDYDIVERYDEFDEYDYDGVIPTIYRPDFFLKTGALILVGYVCEPLDDDPLHDGYELIYNVTLDELKNWNIFSESALDHWNDKNYTNNN